MSREGAFAYDFQYDGYVLSMIFAMTETYKITKSNDVGDEAGLKK